MDILGDHAGHFGPAHGPTLDGNLQFAQMLNPVGANPRVVPEPHTNNLNPITCKNAAVSATSLPIAQRNGVATSAAFATPPPSPDQAKQILDTIADPTKSFFFNTDCISCHTETRRTMELLNVKEIPGINPAALPNGPWDVRNFGWGDAGKAGMQATVTRRTANETAAVVTFINSHP
jgi:mono/diheme cytochrome c family protein